MTGKDDIADFRGLADTHPLLAASIAIALFSLAGLPIFAGFTVKFYLFTVVASSGFLWLAGVAIISSLISLYYYLQIVRQMYIEKSDAESIEPGAIDKTGEAPTLSTSLVKPSKMTISVLLISLIAVVWLGVYPAPLLDVIEIASQALVMGS